LENTPKSRFRNKRWLLLIDAALTVIILLIGLILLKYKPADYNAISASEEEISSYLVNELFPQFYNGMQREQAFEVVVEQNGINEAIGSFGWPQIHNGLIISTPVVFFTPERLRLMAMLNYEGVDTVITVEVIPRFDSKGLLNLEIDKVKMGALGITFVTKKIAKKMFDDRAQFAEADNIASLALESLLAEKPFEPVFVFQGKKMKIDNIALENKIMKIHITPIGAAPGSGY
jgi:hypothetical protein